jgi:hypothetical protein
MHSRQWVHHQWANVDFSILFLMGSLRACLVCKIGNDIDFSYWLYCMPCTYSFSLFFSYVVSKQKKIGQKSFLRIEESVSWAFHIHNSFDLWDWRREKCFIRSTLHTILKANYLKKDGGSKFQINEINVGNRFYKDPSSTRRQNIIESDLTDDFPFFPDS